jgi:hypothetical protein
MPALFSVIDNKIHVIFNKLLHNTKIYVWIIMVIL